MRRFNPLRAWVLAVNTVGTLVILQALVSLQTTPHRYEWLFFAALTALAGSFSLKIGSISARVTISDTFFITTALLFGPAPATLAVALGTMVSSWRRGHARDRVMFNTSTCAFAIWAGAQVFFWMAGVPPLTHTQSPVVQLVTPLLSLTAVYFIVNTGLIAVAVALDTRRPVMQQQVRKQLYRLAVEERVRAGAGRERGDVARRAPEGLKDLLAALRLRRVRLARHGREKPHVPP